MCRIAAYLGPPVPLSALLDDPPHGLTHQSRNAREMTDSSVAGDGWGVAWFAPGDGTPGLLKSILPLWSDENGRNAPRGIVAGSAVGHVRLASPNVETCFTNTPLYVVDNHLWTVNGALEPWPGPLSKALRDRLDADHEADLRGATDGEMLGALWRTRLRRTGGDGTAAVAQALRSTLALARSLARTHRGHSRINVIVASLSAVLAVRHADTAAGAEPPNSLYYLDRQPRWSGGAVIASEPLDDGPGWNPVPPETLVVADAEGVRLEPLDLDRADARLRQSA